MASQARYAEYILQNHCLCSVQKQVWSLVHRFAGLTEHNMEELEKTSETGTERRETRAASLAVARLLWGLNSLARH
jgi:hypothetical protein